MGTKDIILNALKKYIAIGLVGITVTDRYAGVCPVRGSSMSPTFNPSLGSFTDDYVFLEKFCLDKYRFSHGDVVIFSSPTSYNERSLKRIVAMEGDYISNVNGAIKVPEGHCWVEGDNSVSSVDSRSFGAMTPRDQPIQLATTSNCRFDVKRELLLVVDQRKEMGLCQLRSSVSSNSEHGGNKIWIPLGLIHGRVTHIIWPPQRIGKVDRRIPQDGLSL